jgi:hypothetical protein
MAIPPPAASEAWLSDEVRRPPVFKNAKLAADWLVPMYPPPPAKNAFSRSCAMGLSSSGYACPAL